ncbi:TniQ family protein [Streptomyces sp. NBC_00038]|uniref:TniQ family protein n=1 Tax=Streptomyces sp. NBC_00038 TaxID=2903615 RepID=UPI00224D00C6|nr:TniQ family protein [Streptomyces sp. NBC_00038]MCX5559515.1 TniQ family protein [Streptomyces sp. NBC_00038]
MQDSGLPRRLPAVLAPEDGESFASWLTRAAADCELSPGQAAQAIGLECRPGSVVWPRFFGVVLTQRSLLGAEAATGLDAPSLHAMQLARYRGTVLDFAGLDPAAESSLTPVVNREWALFTASRACPKCLAERPVWPLWWRLGIAAVCPVHRVLLVDVCRRCGLRVGRGYAGHPRGLITRLPVAEPTRCHNRRPAGRRRKAGLCDQKLQTLPAVPVPAALAALQQRILAVADGASGRVAGSVVESAEFFAALRFTTAVVRLVASEDDLASCAALPGDIADAFLADQHEREQARQGGAGTQLRASPPSAAHAASVLALSANVLFTRDRQSAGQVLAAWTRRAVTWRRTPGKSDPLRPLAPPACLQALVRAAQPPASRVVGALSVRPAPDLRITADHLPHLVDTTDYTDLIACHLPGTAPASGRRLAALALVRLGGAASWQRAAADLDMNLHLAARVTNTLVQRISDPYAFWTDIEKLGTRLQARGRVDYAARRSMLAGLTTVPHAVLYPVCRPLEHDVTLQRRRHAAAWVWQHFTGGDVREAPAYAPALWPQATTESLREGWRRFAAWIPVPVARQLTAFGRNLLDFDATDATGGA